MNICLEVNICLVCGLRTKNQVKKRKIEDGVPRVEDASSRYWWLLNWKVKGKVLIKRVFFSKDWMHQKVKLISLYGRHWCWKIYPSKTQAPLASPLITVALNIAYGIFVRFDSKYSYIMHTTWVFVLL